ncbi:MAG: site-specific integrase [Coriobacteriia bacterium]|nr:site-specific integrase [Coriobacteriia bacterium]
MRNHVQVLRQILEYGVMCGLITENPVSKVVLPRQERPEMHYLTGDELHELIEATSPSWRLLVAMAALTGTRKGEQLALQFSDCDIERRSMTITKSMRDVVVASTKTRASVGMVPLPGSLIPLVDQRRRQVVDPNGLIFCRRDGLPLSDGSPNRELAKALSVAGLPDLHLHDLRKAYASHLAAAGRTPAYLEEVMGHRSYSTTMKYYTKTPFEEADRVRKDVSDWLGREDAGNVDASAA